MTKNEALHRYFGHTAFRPAQEILIDALLSGRDVLGIMPTGAGKSICYQIPALLLDGLTLIISPLISLMKDQVASLKNLGLPSAYINSSLTPSQYVEVLRRAEEGRYKIIYVAPERLGTEAFREFALRARVALVAIDEAHCVSQWGQDFRPSYLKIADFIKALPARPAVGAFTATATAEVKSDIEKLLELREPVGVTTGFDRPNLRFSVERPKNKHAFFLDLMSKHVGECGIVYCATRKTVDSVGAELRRRGFAAARYHAGLEDDERKRNQEDFINGEIMVMVATNAFGMGIDKPNVRFVIHYNMPKNMESYYQEAGRAGRDGAPSECTLLFSDDDIKTAEFLIGKKESNTGLTERERSALHRRDLARLDKMTRYCEIDSCLRLYILKYFGEHQKGKCHNCGNCNRTGRKIRLFGR